MILTDEDVQERFESPLNLLNRLKTTLNKVSSNIGSIQHPSLPPKAEDIVADLEDKLKHSSTRTKATSILMAAMTELERRLPEVQKPEKLAQIATEMGRVISATDDARRNNGGNINSQIIVYAPQVQKLENFDIIDVAE